MGQVNTCYIALSSLAVWWPQVCSPSLLFSCSPAPQASNQGVLSFPFTLDHFQVSWVNPTVTWRLCTCKSNLRGFFFWKKASPIDILFLFGPQTSYQRGPIPAKCCLSPALFFDGPVADLGPARVHFACKPGELILCFLIWAKNNVSACHFNNFFIDSQRWIIYINISCAVLELVMHS